EERLVAGRLAAELGHFAGDDDLRARERLRLAGDRALLRDLVHVVAVQEVEAVRLREVRLEDRLGLVAETVRPLGKDPAHIRRGVRELADRERVLRTLIVGLVRRDRFLRDGVVSLGRLAAERGKKR